MLRSDILIPCNNSKNYCFCSFSKMAKNGESKRRQKVSFQTFVYLTHFKWDYIPHLHYVYRLTNELLILNKCMQLHSLGGQHCIPSWSVCPAGLVMASLFKLASYGLVFGYLVEKSGSINSQMTVQVPTRFKEKDLFIYGPLQFNQNILKSGPMWNVYWPP